MGTWGCGPLENDSALDLHEEWEASEGAILRGRAFLDRCARRWGRALHDISPDLRQELLAATHLLLECGDAIPGDFRALAEQAIEAELEPAPLGQWGQLRDQRAAMLRGLRDRLRQVPEDAGYSFATRSPLDVAEPDLDAVHHEMTALLDEWAKVRASGMPWAHYYTLKVYSPTLLGPSAVQGPSWFIELNCLMNDKGSGHEGETTEAEWRARHMMLATYLGCALDLDRPAIESMLDRCRSLPR